MFLAHNCFKVENFFQNTFIDQFIFVYWPQSDFVMREYISILIGGPNKWGYNYIVQHVCGDIIWDEVK